MNTWKGEYNEKAFFEYQVDSLDPSKRVVVDRWSCLKYELYESENSTTLKDSSEFILHEK